MYTNTDLARLNKLFKSESIGDLQVSYKTHLALNKIAKAIEDELKPLAEVELKLIKDGQEDEQYQEFIAGQNQLRREYPEEFGTLIVDYTKDNENLLEAQHKRTQDFQELLAADADIEIEALKEEDHPDLFAADLTNSEWGVLGLILGK